MSHFWTLGGRALWGYGLLLALVNFTAGTAMAASPLRILAFGDSLTAGYMLAAEDAFPAQLERALRRDGYQVSVVNAGVSGDTTADGLARLDWALGDKPTHVLVELGANDALRGLDPAFARDNLDKILGSLRGKNIPFLLGGMLAPRNLGGEYGRQFDAIFPDLAQKYKVPLYPFFLDGVAQRPGMTLSDGLHPSPQGVAEIVRRILPLVESWLGPAPGGKEG